MLLVGNGRVFTQDSTNPYLKDGAVVIDGEVIREIGPFEKMKEKYPGAELIDAHGQLIMPGFINAHLWIMHCIFISIRWIAKSYVCPKCRDVFAYIRKIL